MVLIFNLNGHVFASDNKDENLYKRIFSPDYLNVQYAGNAGLGSMGIGYISKDGKKKFGLNYGYLPKWVNGVQAHSVSAKGAFQLTGLRPIKSVYISGYAGTNFIYSMTHNTFATLPGYYLDNYYIPTAFHFAPFIGLKMGKSLPENRIPVRVFYFELGTIDYYLINSVKHSFRHFFPGWNLCVGISLPL